MLPLPPSGYYYRTIDFPLADAYGPSSASYIQLVKRDIPILRQLEQNGQRMIDLFSSLPSDKLFYRYAKNKWTLKELLVHLIDDERIYAYRALRFARGDHHVLPGFDQETFNHFAKANERELTNIVAEYISVRNATITLYNGLPEEALDRKGSTDEFQASVRALLFHIVGHELDHLQIIYDHYLREAKSDQ